MQVRILCVKARNIELFDKLYFPCTGSLSGVYFSIDNHPLTIVEADGTSVEPKTVKEVFIATAQVCPFTTLKLKLKFNDANDPPFRDTV